MKYKSILIIDTTKEEREAIIRESLDCGGGCDNCSSCWLGGGSPWDSKCHSTAEQFCEFEAYKGCQSAMLLALMCAGTEWTDSVI